MCSKSTQSAVVQTEQGAIRGTFDIAAGLHTFFGIPYAKAPVGALRFRPPQPYEGWSGVRDASRFGSASAQLFDSTEGEFSELTDEPQVEGQPWVGSEDCLTLNVWTPAVAPHKKPVVIWIHGGANWLESSRLEGYHGDQLAKNGDLVFVSINYRLGVFGFLDVSVLGGTEYSGSHSHGLLDQLQAVRWVCSNIAQFGGDPENITLMGESAGSIDISWHLAGGHLNGLVRRVVMMSGYAGLPGLSGDLTYGLSDASAGDVAREFFADCGIDSFQQLNEMTTADLMMKVHQLSESRDMLFHMDSLFWPKSHAKSSLVDPIAFAAKGEATGIDIIIGFTNYEMGLWLNWDEQIDQLGMDSVIENIGIPARLAESVKNLYCETFPDENDGQRAMHLLGDSAFVMPSLWAAEGLARNNRVKVYRFDRETDPRRRAQHAADQVYFFDKLDTYVGKRLAGLPANSTDSKERESLVRLMQGLIFNYAETSQPDYPAWADYDTENRPLLALDADPSIKSDPYCKRREWWFQNIYPRP
ncbi:putative esterase [Pseudomonas sp. XWY-1]|uniref:carboxylesterase/lipase family protein n=1 Tax=Pseudomonas TaxID=286 RepID=UPI000CDC88D0|nr:carboxylesterase family protein [Pseudomonas sp. XWY-1]AUZ59696.1 putative esterase [Pseudomonas sp. XWY-1]